MAIEGRRWLLCETSALHTNWVWKDTEAEAEAKAEAKAGQKQLIDKEMRHTNEMREKPVALNYC